MFKKILVPTDASGYSLRALTTALEIARKFQSEIYLLHVMQVMQTPSDFSGYNLNVEVTLEPAVLQEYKDAVFKHAVQGVDQSGVNVSRILKTGYPVTTILDFIEENGIDLVVMGSHGYGPITGSVLGSVSQRVLQKAPCPILLSK